MWKAKQSAYDPILVVSAVTLILFRAILMVVVPLMDKTEARYAEIARLMVETQNWGVLQIDYNVPFWAKPPLSTWASAFSINVFGVTEWAARLPSLVISLVTIYILYKTLKKNGTSFFLMAFILMTTPQFLLHAAVVSTDTIFGFCIMMVMLCFWNSQFKEKSILWGYGFFVFMGLGLLAKGPVVMVLTLPPLAIWSGFNRDKSKTIFRLLPWYTGVLLTLSIAIPWYILAEKQSPGFLSYFLVGEHLGRFLEAGWQGDLYGFAKSSPKGTVWIYLLIAAFPWIQLVIYWLWQNRTVIKYSSWVTFLTLWLVWTPLFFTFSGSVVHTYIIPVMAPTALLAGLAWNSLDQKKLVAITSLILPTAALAVFLAIYLPGSLDYHVNSDKGLIEQVPSSDGSTNEIYSWKEKSYSAQFYSQGKIKEISSIKILNEILDREDFYLIVDKRELNAIPIESFTRLPDSNNRHILLKHSSPGHQQQRKLKTKN